MLDLKKGNKKGALELSIGTVVILVLAMSMLILGLILVKNILGGGIDVADMTIDQIKKQVSEMFGDDDRLVVYPDTRNMEIDIGEQNGFLIGIKNLIIGQTGATDFSYEISVADVGNCGVDESKVDSWIVLGKSESLEIAPGQIGSGKILLNIPEGSPLCSFRYRINVRQSNEPYASDMMDITIAS